MQKGSLLGELRLLAIVACLFSLYEPKANLTKNSILRATDLTARKFAGRPFFLDRERERLSSTRGGPPEWMIYDLADGRALFFDQRYEWYCGLWKSHAMLAIPENGARSGVQIVQWANLGDAQVQVPTIFAVGLVLKLMLPCAGDILQSI